MPENENSFPCTLFIGSYLILGSYQTLNFKGFLMLTLFYLSVQFYTKWRALYEQGY